MSTDWNLHLIRMEGPSLESFSFEEGEDSGVTWYHFSIKYLEFTVLTGIFTFPINKRKKGNWKQNQNHETTQSKVPHQKEKGQDGRRVIWENGLLSLRISRRFFVFFLKKNDISLAFILPQVKVLWKRPSIFSMCYILSLSSSLTL